MDNEEKTFNEFNEQPVEPTEFADTPYEYAPPVQMVSFGGLSPAVEAIKSAAKSKSFLTATICFTISTLITLISFFASGALSGEVFDLAMLNTDAQTQAIMQTTYTVMMASIVVLAVVPMLLMLIGMWVIYGSGRKNNATLKGLGACRATLIIWDVLMWITLVYTVIVGAILIAASGMIGEEISSYAYEDVSGLVVGGIVGFVVFLIVYVLLALIYVTKMLKTTRAVQDIVRDGFSRKKVSVYVIVINFILVVGSVLGIILNLGLSVLAAAAPEFLMEMGIVGAEVDMYAGLFGMIASAGLVNIIPQVLSIITIICINVALIKLRKKLKAIFAY